MKAEKKSSYVGVSWCSKQQKWHVARNYKRVSHWGGQYDDEIEAAKASDDKVRELGATNVLKLNFPKAHEIVKDAKRSQYVGVTWCKNLGKWQVSRTINGKSKNGGYFIDEVEAAKRSDELVHLHASPNSNLALNFGPKTTCNGMARNRDLKLLTKPTSPTKKKKHKRKFRKLVGKKPRPQVPKQLTGEEARCIASNLPPAVGLSAAQLMPTTTPTGPPPQIHQPIDISVELATKHRELAGKHLEVKRLRHDFLREKTKLTEQNLLLKNTNQELKQELDRVRKELTTATSYIVSHLGPNLEQPSAFSQNVVQKHISSPKTTGLDLYDAVGVKKEDQESVHPLYF